MPVETLESKLRKATCKGCAMGWIVERSHGNSPVWIHFSSISNEGACAYNPALLPMIREHAAEVAEEYNKGWETDGDRMVKALKEMR